MMIMAVMMTILTMMATLIMKNIMAIIVMMSMTDRSLLPVDMDRTTSGELGQTP